MEDTEAVARNIAARKMGLVKDPQGVRLPDVFWHRYREQASKLLLSLSREDAIDLVDTFIQPT